MLRKTASEHLASPLPGLPSHADDLVVSQVRTFAEILVGANRTPDAEKIRDQALKLLDDPRLKSAVADARQTIAARKPANSTASPR